jgi:archaellum component FlaC
MENEIRELMLEQFTKIFKRFDVFEDSLSRTESKVNALENGLARTESKVDANSRILHPFMTQRYTPVNGQPSQISNPNKSSLNIQVAYQIVF